MKKTMGVLLPLQAALLLVAGCSVDSDGPERTLSGATARAQEQTIEQPEPLEASARAAETYPADLVQEAESHGKVEAVATVDDGIDHARLGREAWERGERAEAARELQIASDAGRAAPYDIYLLGLSLWKTGDLDGAESALTDAAWKLEAFPRASLNLARVRIEKGDLAGARAAVDAALGIDADSSPAHNVLGRILLEQGDLDGAAEAFRRASSLDSDDAWPLNNLGYMLLVSGNASEAIAPLEEAVARDPGLAMAWHNLAFARERTGDLGGAALAAARASELAGGESPYALTAARLDALAPGGAGQDSADAATAIASVIDDGPGELAEGDRELSHETLP